MHGFGGHFHFPHLPHGDPWHRSDVNRNMRGGPGKRHLGSGSLTQVEFRIMVGVLALVALGVLYVLVS